VTPCGAGGAQIYLGRKEFRADPSREWDPTLTLLFKIVGLEADLSRPPVDRAQGGLRLGTVGFAVLRAPCSC
jgi:hypothetical protein